MFQLLKAHDLHLKMSKCTFAQNKLVGHVVNKEGVATDPTKVVTFQN